MRAGSEDHRTAFEDLLTGIGGDADLVGTGQLAEAFDNINLAALEQPYQAAHYAVDGLILLRQRCTPIELGLAGQDAEVRSVGDGGVHLGDVKPLLCRDASPDQASSPGRLFLDHGN